MYLNDAPAIKDPDAENVEECGKLHEYFEHDRNNFNDTRFCDDIAQLQCFNDFSNLDSLVQRASSGEGAEEDLVFNTQLQSRRRKRDKYVLLLQSFI